MLHLIQHGLEFCKCLVKLSNFIGLCICKVISKIHLIQGKEVKVMKFMKINIILHQGID